MRRPEAILFGLLGALGCWPAQAQQVHQFRSGEAAMLRTDTAYLLYRTDARAMESWFEFTFVREAGASAGPAPPPRLAATAADAGQNLVRPEAGRVYEKNEDARIYLIAVPPGSYALVAAGYKQLLLVGTCLCMGTVRFEARPGVVTDLGYLLAAFDEWPTSIPELTGMRVLDTKFRTVPMVTSVAVRPPTPRMPRPAALAAATVVPADYRAVGKFSNQFRTVISRLAPLEGVLAYERDHVIDLKAPAR